MRYYFHLTGAVHQLDEEGFEFADLGEARIEAVRSAGELLRDRPDTVTGGDELRLEVTEAAGQVVFTFVATGTEET